jgi:glutathione S-transferase
VLTELWQFRFSHYNEKARWALDFKGWPHRRRTLVPGLHVATMIRKTGQPKTPVLFVDDEVIADSSAIIAWLEREQPEPALYPDDPEQRRRALDLEEWLDEEAGPRIRRLVYHHLMGEPRCCERFSTAGARPRTKAVFRGLGPVLRPIMRWNMKIDAERVAEADAMLDSIFDRVDAEIGPSGFLVGERFGVADLTAASILANLVHPESYPYPWTTAPRSFEALQRRYADHPTTEWVRRIYDEHRSPSAEVATS